MKVPPASKQKAKLKAEPKAETVVKPPDGLTPDEEPKLVKAIDEFSKWLVDKKIIAKVPDIKLRDFPFNEADWTMKFNPKTGALSFNTHTRKKCSFEYYTSIVLHEFFHLAVQRVPNKDDATKIKDDFGGEFMKLIDIEADFYTALFYMEKWGYGLVQYLKIYHEGTSVFRDEWIRQGKLERFMGSMLSICKMFIASHTKGMVDLFDLYLVSISPLNTEGNLHVLVITKEHIYFDFISTSRDEFTKMKEVYTNEDEYPLKIYIRKITTFVCKALNLELPQEVEEQINNLK